MPGLFHAHPPPVTLGTLCHMQRSTKAVLWTTALVIASPFLCCGSFIAYWNIKLKKKKNPDLWIRFIAIYKQLNVELIWVKGHASIPENERCDELAVEASHGKSLEEDVGYLSNGDPEFLH